MKRTGNTIAGRAVIDIFLFFGIVFLPWWFSGAVVIALAFYFHNYYEMILYGIIIDSLYSGSPLSFMPLTALFTSGSFIAYIIIQFLKTKLRGY